MFFSEFMGFPLTPNFLYKCLYKLFTNKGSLKTEAQYVHFFLIHSFII